MRGSDDSAGRARWPRCAGRARALAAPCDAPLYVDSVDRVVLLGVLGVVRLSDSRDGSRG